MAQRFKKVFCAYAIKLSPIIFCALVWSLAVLIMQKEGSVVGFPVNLAKGTTSASEFRAGVCDSRPEATIYFKRTIPMEEIECLIGIAGLSNNTCKTKPELDFRWKLYQGDKLIQEGDSSYRHGGVWGEDIGNRFANLELKAFHSYRMTIESLKDVSALKNTSPRISIGSNFKGYNDCQGTWFLAWLLSMLLGAVWLVGLLLYEFINLLVRWA